jgi:hypothetical protein
MPYLRLAAAVAIAVVLAYGWWRRRRTLQRQLDVGRPRLDEDAIRAIESTGRLVTPDDEPLDLDEIEKEERRFWEDDDWNPAERF